MKNLLLTYSLLFFAFLSCKNDDDTPVNPVDQLPPATQTGENKAGCLVNGEVFLPKGGGLGGNYNCFYQFVDGGYYFMMSFSNSTGIGSRSVAILTQNAEIQEGMVYVLNKNRFVEDSGRGGGIAIITILPNRFLNYNIQQLLIS